MATDERNRIPENGLDRVWMPAFIAALRDTGVVRHAYEAAGMGRTVVYDARKKNPEFAKAWDDAVQDAADLLEMEAIRRAHHGVKKPVIYQGKLCGAWVKDGQVVEEGTPGAMMIPLSVTEYSDTLLIFMLKGIRPEKFKDHSPITEAMASMVKVISNVDTAKM